MADVITQINEATHAGTIPRHIEVHTEAMKPVEGPREMDGYFTFQAQSKVRQNIIVSISLRSFNIITVVAILLSTMLFSFALSESGLPPCPKETSMAWNDCFGTRVYGWPDFYQGKYSGEFKDNKRHGFGKSIDFGNQVWEGDWLNDEFVQGVHVLSSGTIMSGEFHNRELNGQGTIVWITGDRYSGGFVNGNYSGKGKLLYSDGSSYVGEWSHGQYNGLGELTSPSGDVYRGDFSNWKANGSMVVKYSNGDSYQGTYRDGKREGLGSYKWRDGAQYSGQWKDGLPYLGEVDTTLSGVKEFYQLETGGDVSGRLMKADILHRLGYAASDTQIATEASTQITTDDSSRDGVEKYSFVEHLRTMDLILFFLVGFSVFISLILIIILLMLLRRFPSSTLSRVESNSSDRDDALEIDLSKSDPVGPKNIENSGETATDGRVVAHKGNLTKPENESQFVQPAALPKLEQLDKINPTQPTEQELAKRDAKRRQQQREFRLNIGRSWKKSDK